MNLDSEILNLDWILLGNHEDATTLFSTENDNEKPNAEIKMDIEFSSTNDETKDSEIKMDMSDCKQCKCSFTQCICSTDEFQTLDNSTKLEQKQDICLDLKIKAEFSLELPEKKKEKPKKRKIKTPMLPPSEHASMMSSFRKRMICEICPILELSTLKVECLRW